MKNHPDFKYLYEHQMLEMSKIAMRLYSYDYYLHNFCILRILSNIVSNVIMSSIINHKSREECISDLKNTLVIYRSEIKEIDTIIQQNLKQYQINLINFIKMHYPKAQKIYYGKSINK